MRDRFSRRWIGAIIGGGIAGTAAWFAINRSWTLNGVGVLERQGWPLSAVYLWTTVGIGIGILVTAIREFRARRQSQRLKSLSDELGLVYSSDITAHELGDWSAIPIFRKWSIARNHLRGQVSGVPVEMFDYTYIDRGDDNDSTFNQTILLLHAADAAIPDFELRPRSLGIRLMGLFGFEGIDFSSRGQSTADAQVIEQFNKNYRLSEGLEAEAAKYELGTLATDDKEIAIRQWFRLNLLDFFGNHSGWWIQCAKGRLAMWQPRKIISPQNRLEFIGEALAIRDALSEPAVSSHTSVVIAGNEADRPQVAIARASGALVGGVAGFFGGGILGGILAGWIFFHVEHGGGAFLVNFLLEAAVFFGGAFGGLVFGMLAGRRLLARPLGYIQSRRAASILVGKIPAIRQSSDNKSGSRDADVETTINFPAPGLVGGCGCFVFLWSMLWNLFVVVATPIFLVAAFKGEMKHDGTGEAVHPATMILFLIPFWIVGLTAIWFIITRGRRRALIRVTSDKLLIEDAGAFGCRQHEWQRGDLAGVHVSVDSGSRPCLLIQTVNLPPLELLTYRNKAELALIAKTIVEKMNFGRPSIGG